MTGEHRTVFALHAVHARCCRRSCFLKTPRERILYDAVGRALNIVVVLCPAYLMHTAATCKAEPRCVVAVHAMSICVSSIGATAGDGYTSDITDPSEEGEAAAPPQPVRALPHRLQTRQQRRNAGPPPRPSSIAYARAMSAFRAEDRSSEQARRWIDEENARRQTLTTVHKTPTDTGAVRDAPVPAAPDELVAAENARYRAEGTQSIGGPPPVQRATGTRVTTRGARTEGSNRRM